jgi:hypothetical protein
MPASSFSEAACASDFVSCVGERFASSISRPISSRIIPPAISNAGSVMPNKRNRYVPAIAKNDRQTHAVRDALRAVRNRFSCVCPAVTARKVGSAANGSTRKKMELRASSEKRT